MPNCDFYAVAEDCVAVLDFIFLQPEWTLYEMYSRHNHPVRAFHSTESVREAFALGEEEPLFQLHTPVMGGKVEFRHITLRTAELPEGSFRYSTEGWGLIQVYFGSLRKGQLSYSHTNHNSERGSLRWALTYPEREAVATWNWPAVQSVSGKLGRYIRKLGLETYFARPVLKGAYEARLAGQCQFVI